MGRNTTDPSCSRGAIIRLEAAWRHRLACAGEAVCRPAVECYRPRQTTDDDSHQRPLLVGSSAPPKLCVGEPVIIKGLRVLACTTCTLEQKKTKRSRSHCTRHHKRLHWLMYSAEMQ